MSAEKNTPEAADHRMTRRLLWKRRILLTWPCLISLSLGIHFYFAEIHSTLSWLIDSGHPMNDWMSYFEFDNQLLPLFFLALCTLLMLFQRISGAILFLWGPILYTIGSGLWLLRYYFFQAHYINDISQYWIGFIISVSLSIAVLISLVFVDLIDGELKRQIAKTA